MQVLKEDIRGRILTVARQQFERKGYSKTSMREVAELAGVGVGNIYNYFTNKDELFREVVRPVLCALEAMLQEHHGIRGEDIMMMRSEKYLKSCIDEYVSLIDKHRALMGILLFHAQGSSLERFRENYTDRSTEVVKACLRWNASARIIPTALQRWSRRGSRPCSRSIPKSIRRCPTSSSTCILYGCSRCSKNC